MKIKQLNELATDMVGDGNRKNLFFFTVKGDVQLIGTDFDVVHKAWNDFVMSNPRVEAMVEDRKNGVVCSAGIEEIFDDAKSAKSCLRWMVLDDSKRFGLRS